MKKQIMSVLALVLAFATYSMAEEANTNAAPASAAAPAETAAPAKSVKKAKKAMPKKEKHGQKKAE